LYDYKNDVAWVGGAVGWLHKIAPVFKGTIVNPPTEIRSVTGPFPVQMSAGSPLSSPVYDSRSNQIFVGDASGYLYRVNATTGATTRSAQLYFGTGIVESAVLDSSRSEVFVFASSDGTSDCGGAACAAVYGLSTSFAAGTSGSKVTVGTSVIFGNTPNPLYTSGFDSSYLSTGAGNLFVCGNTGGVPTLYAIPIQAGVFGTPSAVTTLAKAGHNVACSPVADVYNPNATGGPTERVFVSVQGFGLGSPCGTSGCIMSFVDTPWKPSTPYAIGQRVFTRSQFGNVSNVQVVVTAGTSGIVPPNWGNSAGTTRTDGTVTWLNQGTLTPNLPAWAASHSYGANARIVDSNGNLEIASAGTSGGTPPACNTTAGLTTTDNGVTWRNAGASSTASLVATGGTSGIIVDNVSTFTGASQVYFSTLADGACTTNGGNGGCAVQASQSGLQ